MASVRAVLIGIDGILTVSWEPLPGAVAVLREVREAGFGVAPVTRTTSRTRASIASVRDSPCRRRTFLTAASVPAAFSSPARRRAPRRRCAKARLSTAAGLDSSAARPTT